MPLRVIVSSPSLELSGANVLVANLLDQLQKGGVETEWLVSGHKPADDAGWLGRRKFPIHRLPPTRISDVRRRQKLLLEHVARRAPCVFLPNFDFDMACVATALPREIATALIVHCDDKVYYDFASRYGSLFNALVCVSEFVAAKLRASHPALKERIVHIPFGVEPPANLAARTRSPHEPLQVAYCGRISFHQKRVQDLARIINQCRLESLPVKFNIAGAGPDEEAFFSELREPLAEGTVSRLGFLSNPDVLRLLGKTDVLLMTSDFEGLPMVLLEAMSRGCVPVVTRTESGMSELVQPGENGFLLPVGDTTGFTEVLKTLSADSGLLARLRQSAFERISSGGFTLERAAADYRKLFESFANAGEGRTLVRNAAAIVPSHYRMHSRVIHRLKKLVGTS